MLIERPELGRVLDPEADIQTVPISLTERRFVQLVILHLNSVIEARRAKAVLPIERIEDDVRAFFQLPIPRRVWLGMRDLQNQTLIDIVERELFRKNNGAS